MKRNLILSLLIAPLFVLAGCGATPTKFDNPPSINNSQSFYDAAAEYFAGTADTVLDNKTYIYNIPFYQYANKPGNEYTSEWARINEFVETKCRQQKGIVSYPRANEAMKSNFACSISNDTTYIRLRYSEQERITIRLAGQEQITAEKKALKDAQNYRSAQMNVCFVRNMLVNDMSNLGLIVKLTKNEALVIDVKTEEQRWYNRLALTPANNKLGQEAIRRDPSCLKVL